jgi:hypothetical protein
MNHFANGWVALCAATACSLWSAGTSPRVRAVNGSGPAAGSVVDPSAGALRSAPFPESGCPVSCPWKSRRAAPRRCGTGSWIDNARRWALPRVPPGRSYPKPAKAGGPSPSGRTRPMLSLTRGKQSPGGKGGRRSPQVRGERRDARRFRPSLGRARRDAVLEHIRVL